MLCLGLGIFRGFVEEVEKVIDCQKLKNRIMSTKFDKENWCFPKYITNPCQDDDIEKYLSSKVLELYNKSENKTWKGKIERIATMLEFAGHLENLSSYMVSQDTPITEKLGDETITHSHISFNNHDYSGIQWDIEAQVFYMYVSIIDTLANSSKYMSPADYVQKYYDISKHGNKNGIINLLNKYSEEMGLSRNFKKVFTETISDSLRKEFCDNVIYFKSDRKTDYTAKEIDDIVAKWVAKDAKAKINDIATKIYSFRSQFTHNNIRAFVPNTNGYQKVIPGIMICRRGTDLMQLLKQVILELCEKRLIENQV